MEQETNKSADGIEIKLLQTIGQHLNFSPKFE